MLADSTAKTMDFLRTIPFVSSIEEAGYLDKVLTVIGIFAAFFFLKLLSKAGKAAVGATKSSSRIKNALWPPEKQASSLEKRGNFEQAALLYKEVGKINDAVRCYQKLDDPVMAGEFLEAMDCFAEAEEMYRQAESKKHLKNVLIAQDKWDEAAEILLAEGKNSMAADAFEKAGMLLRAAEIHDSANNFNKAGNLYKSAGESLKAAEAFEKAYMQDKVFMKERPELAVLAGDLFAEAGSAKEAGKMYALGNRPDDAAAAYESAGMYQEAGELYFKAKQYEKAAECFKLSGDTIQAALVMAEHMEAEGNLSEAAAFYHEGDNTMKAAEMFEAAEMHAEAAECYAEMGEYRTAAECFEKSGQTLNAAEMFQHAGKFEHAAELFLAVGEIEKAISMFDKYGRFYDAGMLLAQLGMTGQAITALKKVSAEDRRFREANYLLGNILRKNGLLPEAIDAYKNAVAQDPVGTGTMDIYYNLALILEKEERHEEARPIFREIFSINPDYKDVRQRTETKS